jgi:hypothetical protein
LFSAAWEILSVGGQVVNNSSSTGGSIESLPDAEDQAKEAKDSEAACGCSQASEEAEEAKKIVAGGPGVSRYRPHIPIGL